MRLSNLQKLKFIDIVEGCYNKMVKNRELKSEFWNRIANEINNFGPITRSPDEWKEAFRHMRYKVSRKILKNIQLSSDELRIDLLDQQVKQIRWTNKLLINSDSPTGDKSTDTYSTICRICLSITDTSELSNIFLSIGDDDSLICPAQKMIQLTTVVTPQFGDDLPQCICGNCLNSLEQAFSFKLLCEAGDLSLRNRTVTIENAQEIEQELSINGNEFFLADDDFSQEFTEPNHLKTEIIDLESNDETEDIKDLVKDEPLESTNSTKYCTTQPMLEDFAKKKQLICEHCERKFKRKKSFFKHLRNHSERKVYQCSYCPYKGTSKISIRSHVKNHIGEQLDKSKFDCMHCGKSFITESNMRKHVRVVHLKLKNFQCEECGKRFATLHCIRAHMVKHWKVKQFKCALCPSEYYWFSGINKHMKKFHPGTTYLTERQYHRLNDKNFSLY